MIPGHAVAIQRHAQPGGGRHRHRAVAIGPLAAHDHVVHEMMVVGVGGKGQVREDGAEVEHRCELDAELAGRVHGHAELERLADSGRLHARADPSPECRVEEYHVDGGLQHVGRQLLEADHDRVRRQWHPNPLPGPPHAV